MKNLIRFFLTGTIILLTVPFSFSQQINFHNKSYFSSFENYNYVYDSTVKKDTIIKKDTVFKKDTIKNNSSMQKPFKMKKKPWLAVLLSAALPGAGQFYNESYWKTPILLGLTIFFGYNYYEQDKQFRNYRDQYAASQDSSNPGGDLSLKTLREFYRSSRDDYLWYFIIVDFINMVDAYVDAHLFDFTIKDNKYTKFGKIDRTYCLQVHLNF